MRGLISRPGVGRATRHEMMTIVNRRPVDSRTLSYALIESYHELVPKGRYPLAFLFLELDPAAVDVNVHPAKREVRFRNEAQVRAFVIRAVLDRLRELGRGGARGGSGGGWCDSPTDGARTPVGARGIACKQAPTSSIGCTCCRPGGRPGRPAEPACSSSRSITTDVPVLVPPYWSFVIGHWSFQPGGGAAAGLAVLRRRAR